MGSPLLLLLNQGAQAGGFNPASFGNATSWYDVSQGVTVSSADDTPVTANGGSVGNLPDLIGGVNLDNAASGTTHNPTLVAPGQNGLNTLRFDQSGTAKSLADRTADDNDLDDSISASAYTVFVVMKPTVINSSNGTPRNEEHIIGAQSGAAFYMTVDGAGNLYHGVRTALSTYVNATLATAVSTGSFGIAVAVKGGGEHYIRWNGTDSAAATSGDVYGLDSNDKTWLCDSGAWDTQYSFDGEIAEIIFYNEELTSDTIAKVEAALYKKWGLAY